MSRSRLPALEQWVQQQHALLRFVVVGVWNTLFGYAIYFGVLYGLQTQLPWVSKPYLWAMTVAQVVGVVNAYFAHRRVTFSEQRAAHGKMEFLRFSLVYLATLLVGFVVMPVLVEVLYIRPDIAGIVNILLATLLSYIAHRKFTFRARTPEYPLRPSP